MKNIYLGAAYYPELWSEEEFKKDITRMKETGVNCMRIGEFAWSKMEPKEGEFDFSIFEKVVDTLYENGISTVMCTPTCTPPRWLFKKYPSYTYGGILGLIIASPIAIVIKMGRNNINPITIGLGIVLLVVGTWFTWWFGKKTEGIEG